VLILRGFSVEPRAWVETRVGLSESVGLADGLWYVRDFPCPARHRSAKIEMVKSSTYPEGEVPYIPEPRGH